MRRQKGNPVATRLGLLRKIEKSTIASVKKMKALTCKMRAFPETKCRNLAKKYMKCILFVNSPVDKKYVSHGFYQSFTFSVSGKELLTIQEILQCQIFKNHSAQQVKASVSMAA